MVWVLMNFPLNASEGPCKFIYNTFTCHNLGEKLKKMLKEKGTFKEVECEIARYQKTSLKDTKQGGWVTKLYLQNEKHWTKYISQFFFC